MSQRESKAARPRLAPLLFAATGAVAVLVVVFSAARLHFGVDFTDEAYYAAIPYRFVLGDTPYVSELNVRQNAGLLAVPIVKAWVVWTGGSDGLMLALRYSYFALRLVLTALAAFALWSLVPPTMAIATSLLFCAFVLFAIPALGYNTLAAASVSTALLSLLLWRQTFKRRYAASSAGFALVAAFIHPALLPIAAATIAGLIWLTPAARRRNAATTIATIVSAASLVMIIGAVALGWGNIAHLVETARIYAGPPASLARLAELPRRLLELSNGGWLLAGLWLALCFARRLPALMLGLVAGAYVLLALIANNEVALVWLGFASLPLTYQAWRWGADAGLMIVAMLAVAAGVLIALFSTNGIVNAAVGAECAAIMFLVGLHSLLAKKARPASAFPQLASLALALIAVLGFSVGQWRNVYRDDPIIRLTRVVPDGPYRGLHTTTKKLEYLERVQGALRANQGHNQSLLAFNTLTAAYLMVPLRPALPTTWVVDYPQQYVVDMRQALAREVSRAARPVLVLQLFRVPNTTSEEQSWNYSDDVMVRAVMAERPRTILSTPDLALRIIE